MWTYIIGNFIDDNISEGTIYYKNGHLYEGKLKNNLCHGFGIYKLASGRSYKGEFENGNRVNLHERTSSKGKVTNIDFNILS